MNGLAIRRNRNAEYGLGRRNATSLAEDVAGKEKEKRNVSCRRRSWEGEMNGPAIRRNRNAEYGLGRRNATSLAEDVAGKEETQRLLQKTLLGRNQLTTTSHCRRKDNIPGWK
jgi:hypothetical protein